MNRIQMALGFGLVTLIGSVALAGGGKGHGGFGKADTNNDGKVTLAEALAGAKERFQKKDANKDGMLTKDEVHGRMQGMIERADTNKDGKLTVAEFEAKVRDHFTKRDANKDGALSGDELKGRHGDREGKQGREKA
jgi:Ca2+-binding EF-hand superfamily protein